MKKILQRLWFGEEGQDLVEYALLAALVSFGAIAAMKNLAISLSTAYSTLGSRVGSFTS